MSGRARPLLRVLTWNVHGCVGRRRRFDPHGVAAELARLNPDIAALQELDSRKRGGAAVDSFELLREATGWSFANARTIETSQGDYGHALASRWPLDEVERLDLSVRGREPRLALSAAVRHPQHTIRVVAAHLGLGARERRHQIGVLLEHLAARPEGPAIVLGDFNEWRGSGLATRLLCPPFEVAAALPSFPAHKSARRR